MILYQTVVIFVQILSICANLLTPAIIRKEATITPRKIEYYGFFQSALKDSEVEIRLSCVNESKSSFSIQYVLRSSPCAKEFFTDNIKLPQMDSMLEDYFKKENEIPVGYDYDSIYFYRSQLKIYSCANSNGLEIFFDEQNHQPMKMLNVTTTVDIPHSNTKRQKRNDFLNGNTIDGGTKRTLTSWHPAQVLPADAIYILIVQMSYVTVDNVKREPFNITLETQWRKPYGYLSAIDYPLLHFYGIMCSVYIILALVWMIACFNYWKDLLRIQMWIGVVIIVGMLEKAVFYAEYANMNTNGESVEGLIEIAELISCSKRTLAHVLIIIVSLGYGVVRPRLGATFNQVVTVGIVYFLFCSIEGFTRVSKSSIEGMKEKQAAKIPLVITEISIAYWIFTSLINTMRSLRMRRNEVKLMLFQNFTKVLFVAVTLAVIYMVWSIYVHAFQRCLREWKQLWIDTAFWHVFFCSILISVMYLWRPAINNQWYAFTPLLDNSEDENDDDELYNRQLPVFEMVKQRTVVSESPSKIDDKIDNDLKWIESNIPTSLATALLDEDEEIELRQLEISKML